jgi:hypothetical protein
MYYWLPVRFRTHCLHTSHDYFSLKSFKRQSAVYFILERALISPPEICRANVCRFLARFYDALSRSGSGRHRNIHLQPGMKSAVMHFQVKNDEPDRYY